MAQTTEPRPTWWHGCAGDVGRNLSRARNGVKYVTGIDRPKVGTTPKSTVWRRDKASALALRG
jgi:hypothetical protein